MSTPDPRIAGRHGIDLVEIARMRRLLEETPREDLLRIFSQRELGDVAGGRDAARLAARFAAKEACLKLFPRQTALGELEAGDFEIVSDAYGAPRVNCTPRAADVLARQWLADISLSLSHDGTHATAVAVALPRRLYAPAAGRFMYHCLPIRRRVVMSNLKRAFGAVLDEQQIVTLAQGFYGHLLRSIAEFARNLMPWGRRPVVRVENVEAILNAYHLGRGVLVLSGHFGNWEVALPAGMEHFPEYRGRFHVLRRPLPRWLDGLVVRRMRKGGLGVIPKRGSLEMILDRLAARDAVIFIMDQHAGARDGVLVDFFGSPAWTFRSLALVALRTSAPVVPAALWREDDGSHVMRFEEALPTVDGADADEAIAANTRLYNAALERIILRHPEQWFWMHRRWKPR
ncbi:MAG TPA: 4'-phosphopantetheinyl transferase superfamily protein [Candidatus Binataceae bacterium]|nr:4'-phosphopantetheinyl transferase superfamily protein [Candidatus Binataceae bacterium]